jgi:predicted nuclease with TOPRIM domain
MTYLEWTILATTVIELVLLLVLIGLIVRVRRSEKFMAQLRQNQQELLEKMQFNAQLEQELVSSFQERQAQLSKLDERLHKRTEELNNLLNQADKYCQSPQLIRQIILAGYKKGESPARLARKTELSVEEVEWIIEQNKHALT